MTSPFIRAHGYIPGPTERPVATGAVAGAIATVPAVVVAWIGNGVPGVADTLAVGPTELIAAFAVLLTTAGAVYGWIFMRAADDRRGGWLFGLSYGFVVWMLGPGTVLQWATGRPVALGMGAQSLLAAHMLYGLSLGLAFPYVSAMFRRIVGSRSGEGRASSS